MSKYNVEVRATLELSATIEIEAKDQEDADKQADLISDDVTVRWAVNGSPNIVDTDWNEESQKCDIQWVEEIDEDE